MREVLLSSFLKETLRFNILKNEVKRFFVCFYEKTFRQGNRDRAQSDSVQQSLSAFFLLFKVKKAHPALFPPIQKMCTPARRRREHKVILPPRVNIYHNLSKKRLFTGLLFLPHHHTPESYTFIITTIQ